MQIKPFVLNKLTITPEMRAGNLYLIWRGESSERDPGSSISPYLTEILATRKGAKIVLDFADMEIMNSGSLVPIIAFLKKAAAENLPVDLLYNSDVDWQRVSHQCMAVICRKLSRIQVAYRP